jgi:D-amino-acid dehydrogenase
MQSGWLSGGFVAQTDIIVLGAGIVGTCCAVHLAKRGLSVALVDRGAVGEGTSYGNTGIITARHCFRRPFRRIGARSSCASRSSARRKSIITSGFLPRAAPWLAAFVAASRPSRLIETAEAMRPLFARAVPEHEALAAEAGAERYLSRGGWLKLYRTDAAFAAQAGELELAANFGIAPVTSTATGRLP